MAPRLHCKGFPGNKNGSFGNTGPAQGCTGLPPQETGRAQAARKRLLAHEGPFPHKVPLPKT